MLRQLVSSFTPLHCTQEIQQQSENCLLLTSLGSHHTQSKAAAVDTLMQKHAHIYAHTHTYRQAREHAHESHTHAHMHTHTHTHAHTHTHTPSNIRLHHAPDTSLTPHPFSPSPYTPVPPRGGAHGATTTRHGQYSARTQHAGATQPTHPSAFLQPPAARNTPRHNACLEVSFNTSRPPQCSLHVHP